MFEYCSYVPPYALLAGPPTSFGPLFCALKHYLLCISVDFGDIVESDAGAEYQVKEAAASSRCAGCVACCITSLAWRHTFGLNL